MKVDVLSIFPEMFTGPMTESLLKKAQEKKIISINIHNIRSFTEDKHHSTDDRPFGGGPGMVMKPEPIYKALKSLGVGKIKKTKDKPFVVYMSPQGKPLNQEIIIDLSKYKHIAILCGHYEGIDERLMKWVDMEISIGDYVLTGGELPAMVLIDSISRLLPGVVKEADSVKQDSFFNGLLDCPHYTRPAKFKGMAVPEELLSGNHSEIEQWRKKQSIIRTFYRRPELLSKVKLTQDEKELIKKLKDK